MSFLSKKLAPLYLGAAAAGLVTVSSMTGCTNSPTSSPQLREDALMATYNQSADKETAEEMAIHMAVYHYSSDYRYSSESENTRPDKMDLFHRYNNFFSGLLKDNPGLGDLVRKTVENPENMDDLLKALDDSSIDPDNRFGYALLAYKALYEFVDDGETLAGPVVPVEFRESVKRRLWNDVNDFKVVFLKQLVMRSLRQSDSEKENTASLWALNKIEEYVEKERQSLRHTSISPAL